MWRVSGGYSPPQGRGAPWICQGAPVHCPLTKAQPRTKGGPRGSGANPQQCHCPVVFPACGGKTPLTSLEYRGESPLPEERVEHNFSIPDGYYHVKHHHFWSCFNTESHVPYVTIHRIFHLPPQTVGIRDGAAEISFSSLSTSSHAFFPHGLFFCIRQLWLHP